MLAVQVIILDDTLGVVSECPSGGCLTDRLIQDGAVTETEAKALFVQLLAGIQYCHDKRQVFPTTQRSPSSLAGGTGQSWAKQ